MAFVSLLASEVFLGEKLGNIRRRKQVAHCIDSDSLREIPED